MPLAGLRWGRGVLAGDTSSLAGSTLAATGLSIGLATLVVTAIAYTYVVDTQHRTTVAEIARHVTERAQRERDLFALAYDNHVVLKRALEEHLLALGTTDPRERFDALLVRDPDGLVRNRGEGFDGTRMVMVCIGRDVPIDAELRRRVLAFHDVVGQYGPAFRTRFQDTYVTLPENGMVLYWPERPHWCADVPPELDHRQEEYFWASDVAHDPERRSVWTGLFYDRIASTWMASLETPLDVAGRHVGTLGHDVMLDELMRRTVEERFPGAYNLVVRGDGRLIADGTDVGTRRTPGTPVDVDPHLQTTFALAMARDPGQVVVEDARHGEYIAVAKLEGPGWYLLTVLPRAVVTAPARAMARTTLLLGILLLLVELGLLWFTLRRQVRVPLLRLTKAVQGLARGGLEPALDTSRRDELGQLGRAFALMATEVRARETALRESQQLLRSLIDASTAVIYVKDLAGRYLLVNRRFGEIAHHEADEIVGRTAHDLFPADRAEVIRANDREVAERRAVLEFEETVPHDGVLHSYISIKCPLYDASGELFGTCGISTDITERKRAEEECRRLQRAAEEASRLKDEFLATLSHELRTPLNAIVGWAQVLRTEDVDDETEAAALEAIERNAWAQTQLVADLLDVSRIVGGKLRVELRPTAVPPVLEAALDTVRPAAEAKGIRLLAVLDPALGRIAADPDRLQQVLWNLLSNAVKFTPAGGTVAVRLQQVDGNLVIEVRDSGCGIAPSFLPQLFQRFRQADTSDTRSFGGLGLGLAIVRHLVELHGGSVGAWSAGEGLGAVFTVRLPATSLQRAAEVPPAEAGQDA